MPARNSSMELSSPSAAEPSGANRRSSGRVSKRPDTFGAASKRKRDIEVADDEEGSDASDAESSDGEPDEEELREQRRRVKNAPAGKPREPAKKKAKSVNGEATSLAIRPAKRAPRKKKTQAAVVDVESAGGYHSEVFGGDKSLDDAAAWWLQQFDENENEAMAQIFNFVLKCAGCDTKVEGFDVEDTDHYQEKLTEIQEENEARGVYEYPLISRAKGFVTFRDNFTGAFSSLILTMAKTNLLYTNETFMEVLTSWLGTMSSAASRPFRHTAVVASLSVITALCQVARGINEMSGKTARQSAGEKKRNKTAINQGRISQLNENVQAAAAHREQIDTMIQSWFDTIFVHRYCDVDPKIRDECVRSLGQWILILPDKFFDAHYLRYLGWILSDSTKETRHEVVKALRSIYNDQSKLSGLRTFTERYRERMVEMATNDSDKDIRADTIKLLDALREAGFLEPTDIDAVGRCIFEVEPKIRKAVTPFLAETINELYTAKIDDMGGEDTIAEILPNMSEDDDFETPKMEWVKLKSLAEVLQGYDAYDADSDTEDSHIQRVGPSGNYINTPEHLEPRICLVAQSLYDGIPELHEWEVLSGLLLYDHSQTPDDEPSGATEDIALHFKQAFKLTEQEEILLLEVLNASVKMALMKTVEAAADNKVKKTKAQKMESQQAQEDAARHLALLIPRLFNKFGSAPEATSSVLRLYHILNLDIFKDLARDVSEYEKLLEDVRKQFVTHANSRVLQEASQALLHARSHEELEEITAGKLHGLWEDSVATLNALAKDRDLTTRGNLADDILTALSNTVMKISNLSTISDSTEHLDQVPVASKSKKSQKSQQVSVSAIRTIISTIERGICVDDMDAEANAREDALVLQAAQVAKFYLMWKIQTVKSFIETNGFAPSELMIALAEFRDDFQDVLVNVIQQRKGADDVRLAIAGTYLDCYLVFNALGNVYAKGKVAQTVRERIAAGEDIDADLHTTMAMEVPSKIQRLLTQVFAAMEKSFANKAKKSLEEGVDDDPVDMDDEPMDEEEDAAREAEKKMLLSLMAERKLCEFAGHLSLGVWSGVLDGEKCGLFDQDDDDEDAEDDDDDEERLAARLTQRKAAKAKKSHERKIGLVEERLKRNVKHLGANYKQVIDKLVNEHPNATKKTKRAAAKKVPVKATAAKPVAKSAEIVIEDDESSEDEDPIEEVQDVVEEMDVDIDTGAGAEVESVLGD